MEEAKTELLKSVKEHNFLLGDILEEEDALNVESQLNKEIEQLTNTKLKFVDDLVEINNMKTTARKEVESIKNKIAEENAVLTSMRNERSSQKTVNQVKQPVVSQAKEALTIHDPAHKRPQVSQTSNYQQQAQVSQESHYGSQNQALYSQNPMPNFNFHQSYSTHSSAVQYMPPPPLAIPYNSSNYDKYNNQTKPMPSDDQRLSLLSQYNQYHSQYNLYGLGIIIFIDQ